MNLNLLFIGLCFTFCLALTIGGIMLLFRFRELNQLPGYKYLQYSTILFYTFGFYSLWSQILIPYLPDAVEFSSTEYVGQLIFLMGLPFFVLAYFTQFLWAYHCQTKSRKAMIAAAAVLTAGLTLAIFLVLFDFIEAEIENLYSLFGIMMVLGSAAIWLTGHSNELPTKWRVRILIILILSGGIYLLNFTELIENEFIPPLYILFFFLATTLIEGIYMYTASVDDSLQIKSFDDFREKYQITNREAEIVREIYNGKSNQEIADTLFVSLQTIKDHTSRIYQKTQVKSRAQVITLLRKFL